MTLAAITCSTLFLIVAWQWAIIDRITPFLYIPLLALAGLVFASSALFAGFMWFRRRAQGLRAGRPFGLHALTLVAILLIPFTDIAIWLDFHTKQARREAVVRDIETGKLQPNVAHNRGLIALGDDASRLSAGGNEVLVERSQGRTYVLFFTFRGVLNNYAGFLHVPAGGEPGHFARIVEPDGDRTTQVVRFSDRWYFVSGR